ncbi:Hypothetical protein, putative [Bodo saltans]|uniref:Uncharacterized protein n=1 Tax=Bodo saltans TaxID=75058 RepID=A0A0S4JQN8_BODSA|nr:Hypothetical protein, putative [Bodo saltans]|eukprot:CUG92856.1 Hypothetical protein, putative [Bodo saltans]
MLVRTKRLFKKLRPGVLQKFREGIPRLTVVDDIAGVKLGSLQSVSVSPRYVDSNIGLGPLVFHHLNYSSGARGPHRPLVLRESLKRAPNLAEWRTQLERLIHAKQQQESKTAQWIPLPQELRDGAPKLSFAVGELVSTDVLVAPPAAGSPSSSAAPVATSTLSNHSAPSSSPPVAEPWRLGVALDPFIRETQRSVVRGISGLGQQTIGQNEDTFFMPWESVVFDITVPEDTIAMCAAANAERAKKQYSAGVRSRQDVEQSSAGFGLASREHTIRAAIGDVVFLPSQFTYSLSRPIGFQKTSTTASHVSSAIPAAPPHRLQAAHISEQLPAEVVCVAFKYKKYPRLSDAQAKLYIPADYTATRLEEFYRKGGNSLSPQYL